MIRVELVIFFSFFFFLSLLKLLSFSITFYDLQLRLCVALGSTAGGVDVAGKEHVK